MLLELHDLLLSRDHRLHARHALLTPDQLQGLHVVVHLDDMLLHAAGITAAQNAQQLVVRDEEEARKGVALRVQVVVQTLLTLLQPVHDRLQVGEAVGRRARLPDIRLPLRLRHDLPEQLVDHVELLGLLGQLRPDVAAHKDALQVDPLALDQDPDLDDLGDERQTLLPALDRVEEGPYEAGGGHALQAHRVVLQLLHDFVDGPEDVAALLSALCHKRNFILLAVSVDIYGRVFVVVVVVVSPLVLGSTVCKKVFFLFEK